MGKQRQRQVVSVAGRKRRPGYTPSPGILAIEAKENAKMDERFNQLVRTLGSETGNARGGEGLLHEDGEQGGRTVGVWSRGEKRWTEDRPGVPQEGHRLGSVGAGSMGEPFQATLEKLRRDEGVQEDQDSSEDDADRLLGSVWRDGPGEDTLGEDELPQCLLAPVGVTVVRRIPWTEGRSIGRISLHPTVPSDAATDRPYGHDGAGEGLYRKVGPYESFYNHESPSRSVVCQDERSRYPLACFGQEIEVYLEGERPASPGGVYL